MNRRNTINWIKFYCLVSVFQQCVLAIAAVGRMLCMSALTWQACVIPPEGGFGGTQSPFDKLGCWL